MVDNQSNDQTEKVAAEPGDPRVRYVRTDRVLSMPDNWDFAIGCARGEWLTMLADDDGLVPSALAQASRMIENNAPRTIAWGVCGYVHDNWVDPELRNRLTVFPMSGLIEETSCREQLSVYFGRRESPRFPRESPPMPKMMNCVVRREVIENIREATGRVFGLPAPDYSFAAKLLSLEEVYLSVDRPWLLTGSAASSIGIGLDRRAHSGQEFLKEFGGEKLFEHVPLQSPTNANIIAESLLRVKSDLPARLSRFELDRSRYYLTCYIDLQKGEGKADLGPDFKEWRSALRREPLRVQTSVRAQVARRALSEWGLRLRRKVVDRSAVLKRARRLVRERAQGMSEYWHITGEDGGFSNVAEAARFVEDHILRSEPGAQDVQAGGSDE